MQAIMGQDGPARKGYNLPYSSFSDDTDLAVPCRFFISNVDGTIVCTPVNDTKPISVPVKAGVQVWCSVKRFYATGSTNTATLTCFI